MATRRDTSELPPESSKQAEKRARRSRIVEEEIPDDSFEEENVVIEEEPANPLRAMITADYRPLGPNETLYPIIEDPKLAHANARIIPRGRNAHIKEVFLRVNKPDIWEHIAMKTSEKMGEKARTSLSEQNVRKYYSKPVTPQELQVIVGLEIIFRGRRNIGSFKEQFQVLPDGWESWPISLPRLNAILGSLTADFPVLSGLLRESWKAAIDPGEEFCVDEAIFDFFSQVDMSSPQRFIPRKPHPHGLLCFFAAFKTAHGPYVFDLEPDVEVNPLNSRLALQRIVHRWHWGQTPHAYFDAGFSGEETLETLSDINTMFTASVNIAHKRAPYENLRRFCPLNSWIAVTDKASLLWSLLRGNSTEKEQFLVSSGFKTYRLSKRPKIMDEEQQKSLEGVGRRGLAVLAGELGLELHSTASELALEIAEFVDHIASSQPSEVEHPSTGSSRISDGDDESPEALTKETLTKKKKRELVAYAKKLSVKIGSKGKAKLAEDILSAHGVTQDQLTSFQTRMKESKRSGPAAQHVKYRENFNAVDLHDKRWNFVQNHHTLKRWEGKFVMSLLQTGMVNAWTVHQEKNKKNFLHFLTELASELCS
jgi:hypothetical protein